MRFVDAHIHLSDEEYGKCIDEIITDAKNANVIALVSNSMDLKTSQENLCIASRYPNLVYSALGIHPWNVQVLTEEELQRTSDLIKEQARNKALVAVGEIGLDSKYMPIWDNQLKVFDQMLHLAEELDLPAIIHSRGTTAQIVDMLPSYRVKKVLLHWFSNPISALAKAVENGYYVTEGPPAVYSNNIREVVNRVPLVNLLTETDGPVRFFKSPFDGKRTSPRYIPVVAKAIAEIKKLDVTEVAEQIIMNFERFFSVKLSETR